MGEALPDLQIEVLSDNGDIMRLEQLTRSLRAELVSIDGVDAEFPPPGPVPEGAKSAGILSDGALWIFLTTLTGGSVKVAVTTINAWCARERGRTVKVTSGERSVEINGSPDQAQRDLVRELLGT